MLGAPGFASEDPEGRKVEQIVAHAYPSIRFRSYSRSTIIDCIVLLIVNGGV
jgi:hypothetical protein